MKYIVAVSGGVDSVVLLDMLAQGTMKCSEDELIVAHVDHGIRPDSAADERFVRQLAGNYNCTYYSRRFELGEGASEDMARSARYGFLRELAEKYKATIVTAHHRNDLVESVAVNLVRGTGWRGLAVLSRGGMARPLLYFSKEHLYGYAVQHRLEWVEDETNQTAAYMRNRIRAKSGLICDETIQEVVDLRDKQCKLSKEIDSEVARLCLEYEGRLRYFFTMLDVSISKDILRIWVYLKTKQWITRPTAERALVDIKVAQPFTKCELGQGLYLEILKRNIVVHSSDR